MKILVDDELCESNAVCVRRAPEVFDIDDDGRLHLLVERPGPELSGKVLEAVGRCPRGALSLAPDD